MGEPYGEYSPSEEEQFSIDLQMALELSLQELSIKEFNTEMERALEGDVEVSSPVALPKDHPVVAEIRADVEREEAADLKEKQAQSSIRAAAVPQKKVLRRLSQASTWAKRVRSERSRESDRAVPDLDMIPCRDVASSADNIPRLPVGQGALKKVPRKRRSPGGSESSDEGALPSHHVQPPRRQPTPPQQPPTDALPRLEPKGQGALPPKQQLEKKDSGRSTPPSDTEIFLTELEIARQNSLLENWAPPIGNEAELQIPDFALNEVTYGTESSTSDLREQDPPKSMMVDTAALASAKAGYYAAGTTPTGEILDWLSSAQRHDPQLVKIARAIKNYLARKGSPDAKLPCKHCADRCGCIYVTDEYLDEFGMKEAVCDSCDVQLVSGGSDLELTSSGEHKLDSPRRVAGMGMQASKATEELRLRHETVAAQAWLEVQRSSREHPAAQDCADPDSDPAAFVEQWYKRALEGQSSGNDTGDNNTVDQVCAEIPKRTPKMMASGEDSSKLSAKAQETKGWSSRKKYGNKKLDLTSTQSWNTAARVWSPVHEDTLKLGITPGYIPPRLVLRTLPTVNNYPPEEESSSPSDQVSDDTTPDTMETDSESASDRYPDVEKTKKL